MAIGQDFGFLPTPPPSPPADSTWDSIAASWDPCKQQLRSDTAASLAPHVGMDDASWKQLLIEQLPPLPVGLSRAAAIFGLAIASAFIATTRTVPRLLSPPPSPPHSPVEPVADTDD
eukprot:2678999-Prymnesium_polylepis.1